MLHAKVSLLESGINGIHIFQVVDVSRANCLCVGIKLPSAGS
jgi:hypothetical protein